MSSPVSGAKTGAAILGGSADVGTGDLSDTVAAAEKGQDIKVFAATGVGLTNALVFKKTTAAKLGINESTPIEQRIQALKGKDVKLAITTPGSGGDIFLRYVLTSYGVDPYRDLTIVSTGSVASRARGVRSGIGGRRQSDLSGHAGRDRAVRCGPVGSDVTRRHSGGKDQIYQGLWARGQWLNENPDKATATVTAIWKALDYIHNNVQESADVIGGVMGLQLEPNIYKQAWSEMVVSFPKTPAVSASGIQPLIDFNKAVAKREFNLSVDQLATNKYFDAREQSSDDRPGV